MFKVKIPKGISELKFCSEELITCNIYGDITDDTIKEIQASLQKINIHYYK